MQIITMNECSCIWHQFRFNYYALVVKTGSRPRPYSFAKNLSFFLSHFLLRLFESNFFPDPNQKTNWKKNRFSFFHIFNFIFLSRNFSRPYNIMLKKLMGHAILYFPIIFYMFVKCLNLTFA